MKRLISQSPNAAAPLAVWDQSAWLLIAVNLVPLLGVLFLGWGAGVVLGLYWAENVVVGMVTLLKMLTCTGDAGPWWKRLGHAAFFAVHYGAFAVGHGLALLFLIGLTRDSADPVESGVRAVESAPVNPWWLGLTLAGMAVSQLYDYFDQFLVRGIGRDKDAASIMFQPYPRLVVLHVSIVLGAFLCLRAGSPTPAVALLVLLKTGLDLTLHYGRRAWGRAAAPMQAE
ncbi:MAG: hypothetical protein KDA44_14930 [Planctomycetales bacterium]|nr:hypothetical protein [Planctomycetales bacterium]